MTEQQSIDKTLMNGHSPPAPAKKRRTKQWKDLTIDPLSEGFDSHTADYVVGKAPVSWSSLKSGDMFTRTKAGKNLHIKMNDGRGISLDTKQSIEVKPAIRMSFQVWLVSAFNSTTASKADF